MLNPNALTTVARLAAYLGIETPATGSPTEMQLEILINSVSSWVARYTGITFQKTTYTNELYSTEKGQTLNLRHFPLISTEPFLLEQRANQLNEGDWEVVDTHYYTVDEEAGMITMMGGIFFFRSRNGYRVTYTAGYDYDNITTFLGDTEAADVEMAVFLMMKDLYNSSSINYNIKSEKIGDYSVSYGGIIASSAFSNPIAQAVLDEYKGIGGIDSLTDTLGVLTPIQSI